MKEAGVFEKKISICRTDSSKSNTKSL